MSEMHNAQSWLTLLSLSLEETCDRKVPRYDESTRRQIKRAAELAATLAKKTRADAQVDMDDRKMIAEVLMQLAICEVADAPNDIDVELERLADIINDDESAPLVQQ